MKFQLNSGSDLVLNQNFRFSSKERMPKFIPKFKQSKTGQQT